MNSVLEVKNLFKKFSDDFIAVNGISFSIAPGEILGLLGPNGAGKTTTIQMLLGTMTPTSGEIIFFDKNFFKNRSWCLQHMAFASTYVRLPGRLTIYENLDIYGKLYGLKSQELKNNIERLLKTFQIWDLKDKECGALSAGQITRVMVVRAFLSNPKVILLDEPTASLDPDVAQDVRDFIIKQQKEENISILITSHNMDEVTQVCDRVLVLQNGKIIADNSPEQLAATVSNTTVKLLITKNLDTCVNYIKQKNLNYNILNQFLEIEIDEHKVAVLLNDFAKSEVLYEQISINKPTLEDYFLQISKSSKNKKI